MGEEPDRVASDRPASAASDPSEQDLRKLESEIAASRERLSDVVAELDRRRHALLSPRANPLGITAIAAGVAIVAAGAAVAIVRARKRRRRFAKRSRQLRYAVGRMVRHPERVASDAKSPLSRIAVVVVPILVKRIADRVFRRR
jgi:hypothetical protein